MHNKKTSEMAGDDYMSTHFTIMISRALEGFQSTWSSFWYRKKVNAIKKIINNKTTTFEQKEQYIADYLDDKNIFRFLHRGKKLKYFVFSGLKDFKLDLKTFNAAVVKQDKNQAVDTAESVLTPQSELEHITEVQRQSKEIESLKKQLEKMKRAHSDQVASLEESLATIKQAAANADIQYDELKAEKEALEQQLSTAVSQDPDVAMLQQSNVKLKNTVKQLAKMQNALLSDKNRLDEQLKHLKADREQIITKYEDEISRIGKNVKSTLERALVQARDTLVEVKSKDDKIAALEQRLEKSNKVITFLVKMLLSIAAKLPETIAMKIVTWSGKLTDVDISELDMNDLQNNANEINAAAGALTLSEQTRSDGQSKWIEPTQDVLANGTDKGAPATPPPPPPPAPEPDKLDRFPIFKIPKGAQPSLVNDNSQGGNLFDELKKGFKLRPVDPVDKDAQKEGANENQVMYLENALKKMRRQQNPDAFPDPNSDSDDSWSDGDDNEQGSFENIGNDDGADTRDELLSSINDGDSLSQVTNAASSSAKTFFDPVGVEEKKDRWHEKAANIVPGLVQKAVEELSTIPNMSGTNQWLTDGINALLCNSGGDEIEVSAVQNLLKDSGLNAVLLKVHASTISDVTDLLNTERCVLHLGAQKNLVLR